MLRRRRCDVRRRLRPRSGLGHFFNGFFGDTGFLHRLGERISTPGAETVVRLPLFAAFLVVLAAGCRRVWPKAGVEDRSHARTRDGSDHGIEQPALSNMGRAWWRTRSFPPTVGDLLVVLGCSWLVRAAVIATWPRSAHSDDLDSWITVAHELKRSESVRHHDHRQVAAVRDRRRLADRPRRPRARRLLLPGDARGVDRSGERRRGRSLPAADAVRARTHRPVASDRRDQPQSDGDPVRLPAREHRRLRRAVRRARAVGARRLRPYERRRSLAGGLPRARARRVHEDGAPRARAAPRARLSRRVEARPDARGRALPRPDRPRAERRLRPRSQGRSSTTSFATGRSAAISASPGCSASRIWTAWAAPTTGSSRSC